MGDWPDHFPEACPPSHAEIPTAPCYRLTKKSTPQERDFVSALEQYLRGERYHSGKAWKDDCIASGLSVFPTKDVAIRQRGATGGMKKMKVAEGFVEGHGEIANTPSRSNSDHQTWWVPENVDPLTLFKAVE